MPNPSSIAMEDDWNEPEKEGETEPTTAVELNKFEIYSLLRLRGVGQVNAQNAEKKLRAALDNIDTRYHD